MHIHKIIFKLQAIFLILIFTSCNKSIHEKSLHNTVLPRIAHAGGEYNGKTYTNSLEALNFNANKFEVFEIDFNFTLDGELVCIHDWQEYSHQYKRKIFPFWKKTLVPPDLSTFLKLSKNKNETNCTLKTLIDWLKNHPDKKIVTDIKNKNRTALSYIAQKYPDHIHQFIPQIYRLRDYKFVKNLGYQNIILTTYRVPAEALKAKNYDLFAVAISIGKVPHLAKKLKDDKLMVYSFIINDEIEFKQLKEMGVDEIYTDRLAWM